MHLPEVGLIAFDETIVRTRSEIFGKIIATFPFGSRGSATIVNAAVPQVPSHLDLRNPLTS